MPTKPPAKAPAKAPAKKPAPKKPLMDWERKPIDPYRSVLGTDKDIVGRGNRTPYEPIPKKAKGGKVVKKFAAGGVTKILPTSKQMGNMNMAKGGSASTRADGCATKGKTKGKQVAMKRGGMC
jgi:hypothetical protein